MAWAGRWQGFRIYDEAQLRELHEKAGFRQVDVDLYRNRALTPGGTGATDRQSFFVVSIA